MSKNGVQSLLMGGQACVLYGAAEFSRDTDLAILAEPTNLSRLQSALDDLDAVCIAVPSFEQRYLDLGLAVHFRCRSEDCQGMRIDVISRMRGVAPFAELWDRRTTLPIENEPIEALSLPDLVQSKKTQRDKDWPMITRLVEANYFESRASATREQIRFWLHELRTPTLLIHVASDFPTEAAAAVKDRELLEVAVNRPDEAALRDLLKKEEELEREADRAYWQPLRAELERLRRESRDHK